jgi:hypothetical protein
VSAVVNCASSAKENMVFKSKSIFFIVINNQYFRKSDVFSVQNFEAVEVRQWKCVSGSASSINEVQQLKVSGGMSLQMACVTLK